MQHVLLSSILSPYCVQYLYYLIVFRVTTYTNLQSKHNKVGTLLRVGSKNKSQSINIKQKRTTKKMRGIAPIIVIVTTIGLIGSIIAIPSCHWVRLRGPNETNRNLGIWRHANEDDRGWLVGNCIAYGTYFDVEVDSHLRFVRWATIISPIFAALCLFGNLASKIAGTVLGAQLSILGSTIAFIFQGLTLTVNFSNACNTTPTSYCMVGITTWAYWLSLCSSICYLISLLLSCGQLSTIKQSDDNTDNNNNQNNQHTPPEQAVPIANVDNNNKNVGAEVVEEAQPLPPPMPPPTAPPAEEDTI